jgi:hypothetical protein
MQGPCTAARFGTIVVQVLQQVEAISDLPCVWRTLTGCVRIEAIAIAVDNLDFRMFLEPISHSCGHAICQQIRHATALQVHRETIARQLGGFEAPIRASATEVEDDQDTPEQPPINRSDRNSETAERERLRRRRRAARLATFDKIRALYDGGSTVREIAQKLGLGRRRVYRWVRRIDLPERNAMAPKPCTPAYFGTFLARSWAEGTTKVRHLFSDIRHRGYTGSRSHLARFLAPWRNDGPSQDRDDEVSADQEAPAPLPVHVIDPMTGCRISPLMAAALCVKPRRQMTARQIVNVDALKAASAEFTTMRVPVLICFAPD